MARSYLVKEFSELTKITVRTLHHYDEIGLLCPTTRSASGHRLYTDIDLIRLQHITILKYLGFSLKKIKDILDKNIDLLASIKLQISMLTIEANRIQNGIRLIRYMVDVLESKRKYDAETITKIIEVMNMSQTERNEWERKFLNDIELNEYDEMVSSRSKEEWDELHKRWLHLLEEIKQNLSHDPGSKIGQELAIKWKTLVDEIYGNYPKLKEKMWEALKSEVMPQDNFPYNKAVLEYIEKATDILKHND